MPPEQTLNQLVAVLRNRSTEHWRPADGSNSEIGIGERPPGATSVYCIPYVHLRAVRQAVMQAVCSMDKAGWPGSDGERFTTAYDTVQELAANVDAALARGRLLRLPRTLDEYLACLRDAAKAVKSDGVVERTTLDGLKSCVRKALGQYKHAEEQMDPPPLTDREAYDWLKEHEGDDLASFETWTRYLSTARSALGEPKNTPRAGREGRSVVRRSDI